MILLIRKKSCITWNCIKLSVNHKTLTAELSSFSCCTNNSVSIRYHLIGPKEEVRTSVRSIPLPPTFGIPDLAHRQPGNLSLEPSNDRVPTKCKGLWMQALTTQKLKLYHGTMCLFADVLWPFWEVQKKADPTYHFIWLNDNVKVFPNQNNVR